MTRYDSQQAMRPRRPSDGTVRFTAGVRSAIAVAAEGAFLSHSAAARYGIALATFVVAAVARWALMPVFGSALPYISFYPAIMVSAWYGGLRPGLLTTALGAITALALWPAGGAGASSLI